MESKTVWENCSEENSKEIEVLADSYKDFLNHGKTERECVSYIRSWAERRGFVDLEDRIAGGQPLQAGEKIIASHMNKTTALYIIGKEPLEKGMNYVGAHIDSPRIDLKQKPLYEDGGLAYFDTHYYGGIKKYQWVTLPLALHGVVARLDGSVQEIVIGED
ncbi:MAG: aminopeptidase, partial [Lachnospiraceae bacterium]|nr:aminopeptidase [Lachnospiraceae bacterium]